MLTLPQTGQSVTIYCSNVATLATQIQQHPCPTPRNLPSWHGAARDLPSQSGAVSFRSLLLRRLNRRFPELRQQRVTGDAWNNEIIFLTITNILHQLRVRDIGGGGPGGGGGRGGSGPGGGGGGWELLGAHIPVQVKLACRVDTQRKELQWRGGSSGGSR